MQLTVATLTLLASFFLGVAVGSPTRRAAKPPARGQARSINVQLLREVQCAVCPEDIETNDGTATLASDQGTNDGITMCIYDESSGTIVCPYVTDTGELNGTVEYCPQTVALEDCVNS
ncbi:uncharacterized protein EDB91DRAFT_1080547 [Suillus paluster]|uniref:uncharacterized protein n=1 Tax=Suillus paluster TaxID=48578 RepID=UPI001B88215F|nr:uncharacterized protein EDB91DRAFT_1080547 [Suillus paluster]KAG1745030.1 hypothetical protein EDB91DRAFT_1080547 [Suillus paluster]